MKWLRRLRILGFWIFLLGSVSANAKVEIIRGAETLKISVSPYPSNPENSFENWYQARQNNSGDRFGMRDYWLKIPPAPHVDDFRSVCTPAKLNNRLSFELKMTQNLSLQEQVLMWAKFNCLREDIDAMSISFPDIQDFLLPQLENLRVLETIISQEALNLTYTDPNYPNVTNASLAIYHLTSTILNPESNLFFKNPKYREGLLTGKLVEFDKKIHSGGKILPGPLVLVTHATTMFDNNSIKDFADATIELAKQKKFPVVYLVNDDGVHDQTWYLNDKKPTQVYFSKNGEHSVLFDANTVIMMGGFFNECLRTSQLDTITRHFLLKTAPLTIHLPLAGIYVHSSIDFNSLPQAEFLTRVIEGSILGGYEVDDDHGGLAPSDMNKLTGIPNLEMYTIHIFTDDHLVASYGSGSRIVHLKFWNQAPFENMLHAL